MVSVGHINNCLRLSSWYWLACSPWSLVSPSPSTTCKPATHWTDFWPLEGRGWDGNISACHSDFMLCILTSSPSSQQTKTHITNYLGLVFVGIILRKNNNSVLAQSQSKHQTVRVTNVKCQNCLDLWLLFMYLMCLVFLLLSDDWVSEENIITIVQVFSATSTFVWWWESGQGPGDMGTPSSQHPGAST